MIDMNNNKEQLHEFTDLMTDEYINVEDVQDLSTIIDVDHIMYDTELMRHTIITYLSSSMDDNHKLNFLASLLPNDFKQVPIEEMIIYFSDIGFKLAVIKLVDIHELAYFPINRIYDILYNLDNTFPTSFSVYDKTIRDDILCDCITFLLDKCINYSPIFLSALTNENHRLLAFEIMYNRQPEIFQNMITTEYFSTSYNIEKVNQMMNKNISDNLYKNALDIWRQSFIK